MNKTINIKYFNGDMTEIKKVEKGDWIDLRCNGAIKVDTEFAVDETGGLPKLKRISKKTPVKIEDGLFEDEEGEVKQVKFIRYKKGDFMLIDLGVAMELPINNEAYVLPRGSSFKNFAVIQTNSKGVVDNVYKGDNDIWFFPVLAQKDGFMMIDERVCQFRVQQKMPNVKFNKVDFLGNKDRSGHGASKTF